VIILLLVLFQYRSQPSTMSKRKSKDDVEPPREFPNPFAEYSGGQLVDASGKVETLNLMTNLEFILTF